LASPPESGGDGNQPAFVALLRPTRADLLKIGRRLTSFASTAKYLA
jgi:hypothetical protein